MGLSENGSYTSNYSNFPWENNDYQWPNQFLGFSGVFSDNSIFDNDWWSWMEIYLKNLWCWLMTLKSTSWILWEYWAWMWSRICIPDISFSISGMTIIHEVTFSGCKWWEIEPRTRMVCLKLGFSKIMAYIYNWYIILKPSPPNVWRF